MCDVCKQTTTSGIVLLVLFQMLRDFIDLLGKEPDLDLGRPGVLLVRAVLRDDLLLRGALESHKNEGEAQQKTILRASPEVELEEKRECCDILLVERKMSRVGHFQHSEIFREWTSVHPSTTLWASPISYTRVNPDTIYA